MEDYKKKYKEALERARQIQNTPYTAHWDVMKEVVEDIFPELKESEDERIWTINYLNNRKLNSSIIEEKESLKKAIAWLEKQSEQKSTNKIEPKFKVGDWVVQENIGVYKIIEICESWYEVIDFENNHYSISFDKEHMCHPWTIQDAKDGDVLDFDCGIGIFKNLLNRYNAHCYCYCDTNNQLETNDCGLYDVYKAEPATKEQRDLLFQKMKEAGYEWDTEKKELKKIEQKPAWSEEDEPQKELAETYLAVFDKKFPILPTLKGKKLADYNNFLNKCQQILGLKYWSIRPLQAKLFEKLSLLWAAWGAEHLKGLGQTNEDTDNKNHAWSEEDEETLDYIIDYIENNKSNDKIYTKKTEILEGMIEWLKSLKERYTWKPSYEQMEALEDSIEFLGCTKKVRGYLKSLYQDLKRLREE